MALFISYSSQDRPMVDTLTTALRHGQQQVWFDQELGGGDSWWNKILEQIRSCEVFIAAVSNHWLQSKPSQSELRYAKALNRPILPVRIGPVDSMRVNPLAALQIIDYQNPTVDVGIQLVTAVHELRSRPVPLPDPLPEEPPVPFGYIMRLGNTLAEKEISPQQQVQVLIELRSGLDEDGDDPSARSDIAQLLRMLRLRHDVTYRTRTEIDNVLASIESAESGSSADASAAPRVAEQPATTPTQHGTAPQPVNGPAPRVQPVSRPEPWVSPPVDSGGAASNKRSIPVASRGVDPEAPYGRDPVTGKPLSDKKAAIAGVLQLFLGMFGAGRFYIGSTVIGGCQLGLTIVIFVLFGVVGAAESAAGSDTATSSSDSLAGLVGLLWLGAIIWVVTDAIRMFIRNVADSQGRELR